MALSYQQASAKRSQDFWNMANQSSLALQQQAAAKTGGTLMGNTSYWQQFAMQPRQYADYISKALMGQSTSGFPTAGAAPTPSGSFTSPFTAGGAPSGGNIGGALTQFSPQNTLNSILQARPNFVQQQQNLLNQYGSSMRQAILGASPELSQAASFYQSRFNNPIPPELEAQFADRIRGAQAARGFGGGGTGPAFEEARYLTGLAEEQRLQLLPQMQQFGAGLLGLGGLAYPEINTGAAFGAAADIYGSTLRNQQFYSQLGFEQQQAALGQQAAEQQSQFSQQYYNWLKSQIEQQNGPTTGNYLTSLNAPMGQPRMNYGF